MVWRDELVDSKESAFAFFERHIVRDRVPGSVLIDLAEDMNDSVAPQIFLPSPGCSADDLENIEFTDDNEVLYFDVMDEYQQGCAIDGFSVGKKFRHSGLGIGLIGIKGMLGITKGLQTAEYIELISVDRDGPGFWPCVTGAMPVVAPQRLAGDIRVVLDSPRSVPGLRADLTPGDRQKFQSLIEVAEDNPFIAWRFLSVTSNLSPRGRKARNWIFSQSCLKESLFIIPGEPGTRQILERYFGIIPPFRPVEATTKMDLAGQGDFAPIGRSLIRPEILQRQLSL